MKELPNSVTKYSQTPNFTQDNVPNGFLNDHNTAEGVWGKLVILKGQIEYTIQQDPAEVTQLNSERFGIIEPQVKHKIKPIGETEFYLEFYR